MITFDMYCSICNKTVPYTFERREEAETAACKTCGSGLEKMFPAPNIGHSSGKMQTVFESGCGYGAKVVIQTDGENIQVHEEGKCHFKEMRRARNRSVRDPCLN